MEENDVSKFVQKSLHSISVPHYKNTMDCATEMMPVPERVLLPMIQHMAAPCEPMVKVGDQVKVGQLIGDAGSPMSAPIYSRCSWILRRKITVLWTGGISVPSCCPMRRLRFF